MELSKFYTISELTVSDSPDILKNYLSYFTETETETVGRNQDAAKAAPGQVRAMHQKFQVHHPHDHYHHHHHHVLNLQQQQQLLNADVSSLRIDVEATPDCKKSDIVGTPVKVNAYGSSHPA
ncbi:hypothetical protein BC332_26523 [Capsicum chinense]|nr:hypothetical protein BC332_26523 [Capsicum chinense]